MKKLALILAMALLAAISLFGAKYEHLYLVGNACDAGWSTDDALEMTPDVGGVFKWEGNLYGKDTGDNGNIRFKFITTRSGWSPMLTSRTSQPGHTLVELDQEMDIWDYPGNVTYDNAFQVVETAKYRIKVDLNVMKMTVTRLGDADASKNPATVFSAEEFHATAGTLKYRKLTPLTVEEGEKYPLVIFLHGKGERGDNNSAQLAYAGTLFTKAEAREAYPAYVLFPQCPSQYFWAFDQEPASFDATTFPEDYPLSVASGMVKELIDSYLALEHIDKDRVYIFGLSMGGMGTYDMVCRFPEVFAAVVPLCGGVNVARLEDERLKNVYWRIFHGDADGVVPVQNSRMAYEKLQALGAEVEYIEVPGADHFVWTPAFEREDFLKWMFGKVRMSQSHSEVADVRADEALRVSVEDDVLTLRCDAAEVYEVYNVAGQRLYDGVLTAGEARVQLSAAGMYVVKAGKAVAKVVVRYK